MDTARALAQAFRRSGEVGATEASPLRERIAVALSRSDDALRALAAAPARGRRPPAVLAALHDLALSGRAPALAAACAAGDGDAAARSALDTVLRMTDAVVGTAARRPLLTVDSQRCTALHPGVADAARRVGADAVGLVDLGPSAGLGLAVDRVGIAYSDGRTLGDPASPVQLSAEVVGGRAVPGLALPEVVTRVGVDRDPVDVADADDVRWLRACVWPDQPQRAARLEAELALAAAVRPVLLRGDAVGLLPEAVAHVPSDALPVVVTTWTLSASSAAGRRAFLRRLHDVAADRPVAWVSVEGVGVAPSVPTLGDRPASGHSTVGVAVLDGASSRVEAVGRCWGRGRWLAWLADD